MPEIYDSLLFLYLGLFGTVATTKFFDLLLGRETILCLQLKVVIVESVAILRQERHSDVLDIVFVLIFFGHGFFRLGLQLDELSFANDVILLGRSCADSSTGTNTNAFGLNTASHNWLSRTTKASAHFWFAESSTSTT